MMPATPLLPASSTVRIVPYQLCHQHTFKALNEEWLERFFVVEPYDNKVLSDPKTYILDPGGAIFMAEIVSDSNSDTAPVIVGTCSMMPYDESAFELTKLAVTSGYQGAGIGKKLMQTCLNWAKTKGLQQVVLFSNDKLTPATRLYESLGFTYFPPPEKAKKYDRCNIAMVCPVA
jgi:GNAT superfamily N-acetyltransferase